MKRTIITILVAIGAITTANAQAQHTTCDKTAMGGLDCTTTTVPAESKKAPDTANAQTQHTTCEKTAMGGLDCTTTTVPADKAPDLRSPEQRTRDMSGQATYGLIVAMKVRNYCKKHPGEQYDIKNLVGKSLAKGQCQ
jgi:hypothetical protein